MHLADLSDVDSASFNNSHRVSTTYDIDACAAANSDAVRSWTLYRALYWALVAFLFIYTLADSFIVSQANNTSLVLGFIAAFFFGQLLWSESVNLGKNLSLRAPKPDQFKNHAIYGFNNGPVSYSIDRDGLGWAFENHEYRYHLSVIDKAFSKGGTLFFRTSLAEVQLMAVPDATKRWLGLFRDYRKNLPTENWNLPLEWSKFDYPMSAYLDRAQRTKCSEAKTGMFGAYIVVTLSLLGMANLWLALLPFNSTNVLLGILASLPIFYLLWLQLDELFYAKRRKRRGLGCYTRCVPGVTHGQTAYRLRPDVLEVSRSHYTHRVLCKGISEIREVDDWIDLLVADQVLESLPNTSEVRVWLDEIGFVPEDGPWKRNDGIRDWRRKVPCI